MKNITIDDLKNNFIVKVYSQEEFNKVLNYIKDKLQIEFGSYHYNGFNSILLNHYYVGTLNGTLNYNYNLVPYSNYMLIEYSEFNTIINSKSNDDEYIPKVGDWVVVTVAYNGNNAKVGTVGKILEIDSSTTPYYIGESESFSGSSWCKNVRKALPHEIPEEINKPYDVTTTEKVKMKFKLGKIAFKGKKGGDDIYGLNYSTKISSIKHGSVVLHSDYDKDYAEIIGIENDLYVVKYKDASDNYVQLGFGEKYLEEVPSKKNPTMREIQEECKRRFPIGCTFKTSDGTTRSPLIEDGFTYTIHDNHIYAHRKNGLLYDGVNYAEVISLPENNIKEDLTGRYLQARCDNPWDISRAKKGDYFIILNKNDCRLLKDNSPWVYSGSSTNYKIHQDFELMPIDFKIPIDKPESKKYTAEEALIELKRRGFKKGCKYKPLNINGTYREDVKEATREPNIKAEGSFIDCGIGFLWRKDYPDKLAELIPEESIVPEKDITSTFEIEFNNMLKYSYSNFNFDYPLSIEFPHHSLSIKKQPNNNHKNEVKLELIAVKKVKVFKK